MNESKRLRATATPTVLRRISLLAMVCVALLETGASAGTDPTGRYVARLNALIDALDDAGTSCDQVALVLERDNDAPLEALMNDVRDYVADPKAEAQFRQVSVALIQDVLETDGWRICAKVTNVRFAVAASHHPVFRGSRVARAYSEQKERDVTQFEAALAAQAAFMRELDATEGCASRAALVRANTTAKTKRQKAAQDKVLFSEDVDQMQYAANRVGEIIAPKLSIRVMRACSTHEGFMTAAYKHPFLSVFAKDYDERASASTRARRSWR
jgi:hypothetical protein